MGQMYIPWTERSDDTTVVLYSAPSTSRYSETGRCF